MNRKMELINQYTRNPVTEDDVYTFNLTLCNNEVDKDFEAFDIAALNQMCELCVGKSAIFDYPWDECQVARIYDAWIETDPIEKTSYGDPLTKLKASAYIIKSDDTLELINEIEAGEKKEISVSCSAQKKICSICGKEQKTNICSHTKGTYAIKNIFTDASEICFYFITDITDFYEWSFVIPKKKNVVAENYKCYDGDENVVKIVKKDCNGKWTTFEMPQTNVTVFVNDENCPVTEEDEIMMIFVNDVCIYSQLAHGPIDWDQVNGFFA